MSSTQMAMAADDGADDLPRTIRRERDAREREARERQAQDHDFHMGSPASLSSSAAMSSSEPHFGSGDPQPAIVQRFEVPMLHLAVFFIKAVLAAIPALILLAVLLWCGGQLLQTFFPQLIKMQILIRFPS